MTKLPPAILSHGGLTPAHDVRSYGDVRFFWLNFHVDYACRQARAVLQVEAARQCAAADRILDAPLLKEAIRQSDLLLVHRQASV